MEERAGEGLALSLALLSLHQVQAADHAQAFQEANKLYEKGNYAAAAAAYQRIIDAGKTSAAVYFNLGNSFLKDGKVGRAIYDYQWARTLAPRDPDIKANLRFARARVAGAAPDNLPWKRLLSSLTVNEWTMVATMLVWAFFALLILGELRPAWKRTVRPYLTVCGLTAVITAAICGAVLRLALSDRKAVVIQRESPVRYGPLEESRAFYTVRDGQEVLVLGQKERWVQVRDANGRIGWLPQPALLFLPGAI